MGSRIWDANPGLQSFFFLGCRGVVCDRDLGCESRSPVIFLLPTSRGEEERAAARSEQRAASSEQRAANSEQRAASSEQRAACSEQRAVSSEQRAARSELSQLAISNGYLSCRYLSWPFQWAISIAYLSWLSLLAISVGYLS